MTRCYIATELTTFGGWRGRGDVSSPLAPRELAVWGPESWFLTQLDWDAHTGV